ncbi:putative mitochondrial protein [Sesamum angolense]|uniref:Mitochondrial protein n=1 Tax=Sesamum angolense TaxID=2727404 RepID=A0AAE1WY96_9LAMI|nr:putative mitochondrial protein [Sesamum angolense]
MNLLMWNCQGLGGPWTVRSLGNLIRDYHPALVFLAETKCSSRRIDSLKRRFDMFGFSVDSRGKGGGLALLWRKSVDVVLQSYSHNHIDVSVRLNESQDWWRFTGLYGEPETAKREATWRLLSQLHTRSVRPWLENRSLGATITRRLVQSGSALIGLALIGLDSVVSKRLENWRCPLSSNPTMALFERLEACQLSLTRWSKESLHNDRQRISQLEHRLTTLLSGILTPERLEEASALRQELENRAAREETVWRQRSKALWLREGDRNTSFFHRRASQRFQTNLISRIKDSSGEWVEDVDGIRRYIISYFHDVFASSRPQETDIAIGTEHLRQVVDASMAEDLLQPFTAIEVKSALFSMAPLKSPGPDDRIISPFQSAFVPGRLITDNVLLAFELNHFLNTKTKGGQGYMALKLDVSKAHDKVEWAFLKQVVVNLALSSRKGSPPRGPLSPYLFLLCTESFCSLIQRAESAARIQGISICRGAPCISHLLFADDTLIFSKASLSSVRAIKDLLEIYRRASGQEINFHKSSVAFSRNTPEALSIGLASVLNIRKENKMELYLGLPSRVVRSKRELFSMIRDRIWKRITGWNDKFLSQAGKEVLIKSIVQAIPSYAMSCFKLPVTLLTEIQGMISNFWWHNRGQRKIHWLSWQRLCDSKLQGGLGFRCLHLFNLAMLAKNLWRIFTSPERPSVVCSVLDIFLTDIFLPLDCEVILGIPLGRTVCEDLLIWHYSTNGLFSVRSAYHLACSMEESPCSSNLKETEHSWWRRLWQTHLPGKVKIFVWRACLNALPTGRNLSRRIPGPACLPLLLGSCRGCFALSKDWTNASSSIFFAFAGPYGGAETASWYRELLGSGSSDMLCCSAPGGVPPTVFCPSASSRLISPPHWQYPPRISLSSILMERFLIEERKRGLVLWRGMMGGCVGWLSLRLAKTSDGPLAEAFAAREAVLFAINRGWQNVVLEGDCATLITKLLSGLRDFSAIGSITLDIQNLISYFQFSRFSFVQRSCNSVAHALAKLALGSASGESNIPAPAAHFVMLDKLATT